MGRARGMARRSAILDAAAAPSRLAATAVARRLVILGAVAALSALAAGCGADPLKLADAELKKQGFTDLQIEKTDDADRFKFKAKRDGRACLGKVRVVPAAGATPTSVQVDSKCSGDDAGEAAAAPVADDPRTIKDKACQAGDTKACFELGTMLVDAPPGQRDLPRAREIQRKACEAGEVASCDHLGQLKARGLGGEHDEAGAMALFTKACQADYLRGCANVARLHHINRRDSEARPLFGKACDGGEPVGCNGLGILEREGLGGRKFKPNAEEARRLFELACDGGLQEGCSNLGVMYAKGEGGVAKPERAKELLAKACEAHVQAACHHLKKLGL